MFFQFVKPRELEGEAKPLTILESGSRARSERWQKESEITKRHFDSSIKSQNSYFLMGTIIFIT